VRATGRLLRGKLTYYVIGVTLLFGHSIFGHPVTWKDGMSTSTLLSNSKTEHQVFYSYTAKQAVGIYGISINNESYGFIQKNTLIKRWNGTGFQGNIYTMVGLGVTGSRKKTPAMHVAIQGDWETRQFYTQGLIQGLITEKSIYLVQGRVGWAPYLVGFDDLSTWLILQLNTTVTTYTTTYKLLPVVRLFKGGVLVELGSNFKDRHMLKAMIHF
jgi:hypothetical protein